VERLTTPLIRQEGGLVSSNWEAALAPILSGLGSATPLAGLISGRNTNEEAFLFAKVMNTISPQAALEVFYQERDLTETAKILMSPDRSPNFRGAREAGVNSNGGLDAWIQRLVEGKFRGAYIVGEDLLSLVPDGEKIKRALEQLSFLVVQDTHLTATARLAHVVLPATNFRRGRVQKLNPALVPPPGTLQDWEIFNHLLEKAGEKSSSLTPTEIFHQISVEVPRYQGMSYSAIGEQGILPTSESRQP
jgi:predicted molibdopterin-dependent oxidoreductase YjgC